MSSSPLHILLIDDNPDDRALVARELRRQFDKVIINHVTDLQSFREALLVARFDLVITDYVIGWTDGLTVLQTVKSQWTHCPVIMFTATGNEEVAVAAMKLGLDDYVIKSPKHFVRLTTAIQLVLGRAQERQALHAAEARYRGLFDAVPVGLFRTTPELHIIDANQALIEMLGYSQREALLRHSLADFVLDNPANQAWRDQIKQGLPVHNVEVQLRRHNGELIWVEINSQEVQDQGGQRYREGSLENITARKEARREQALLLERAQGAQRASTAPRTGAGSPRRR